MHHQGILIVKLECFSLTENPPPIIAGRSERDWMDDFHSRFPYRCLPLTMANTTGWEILCPTDICIHWNGGKDKTDIVISSGNPEAEHFAVSHFSHGVVTFHTGYLFRTPPQWAVWASGAPNHVKDGIQPLTGLVETDWLPFPFTMNWIMTRSGTVNFKKGEPFCFIQLTEHHKMDDVRPVIHKIEDAPLLQQEYAAWSKSRQEFNQSLENGDALTVKQAWQKFYFKGQKPDSRDRAQVEGHLNKRRLHMPVLATLIPADQEKEV